MTKLQIMWFILFAACAAALALGWAIHNAPLCRCGRPDCVGGCLKK